MAKVDDFLQSDVFDDPQLEDEENRPVEPKQAPSNVQEAIDLTSDDALDFESPMISRGKRLSTPLGFLSRNKQQKQLLRQTTPNSTPSPKISSASSVGTLYSYFNKHGFNRQATSTPSRQSPTSPGVDPKLEEDGLEIVDHTPWKPSSSTPQSQQRSSAGGAVVASPYFAGRREEEDNDHLCQNVN